jgi:hypothetical protein
MIPTKDILIKLFETKNRKRRLILYQMYPSFFSTNFTAAFIAEMLNNELGIDSVSEDDVYYINHYFIKNKKSQPQTTIPKPIVNNGISSSEVEKIVDVNGLTWTDIDALPPKFNKFN